MSDDGVIRIRNDIYARMQDMSPSERKVARTLLAGYPSIGLLSASNLARESGTSAQTVLRLASRLGLGSYLDFQRHLRDEIMHDLNSPVGRAEQHVGTVNDQSVDQEFAGIVHERRDLLERLLTTVSAGELGRIAHLLADGPKSVLICGGYYSRFIAEILARQLDQVIPHVDFLADPVGYDIGKFYALNKNSVVVLFDFRRYQRAAQQVGEMTKRQGAALVVITDEGLSPISDRADYVLTVPIGGIPFDSFAALTVLIEALATAVFRAAGPKAVARMKLWEERSLIARAPAERTVRDDIPVANGTRAGEEEK